MKSIKWMMTIILMVAGTFFLNGQNNLETNFDDGTNPYAGVGQDASGADMFNTTVSDGDLVVEVIDRPGGYWAVLGLFGQTLDLSGLPNVEFAARGAVEGIPIYVDLKVPLKSDPETFDYFHVNTTLSTDMETYFFDLSDDVTANPDLDISQVTEIHIYFYEWTTDFSGTITIDYLKFGFSEPLAFGGTGLTLDLSGNNLPAVFKVTPSYSYEAGGEALKIEAGTNQRWQEFTIDFGAVYDLSANPVLNLIAKSDDNLVIQVFLVDDNGNGYQVEQTGSQYAYNELVSGNSEFRQNRIYKGKDFLNLCYDFSDATIPDLSSIQKIVVTFNGTGIGIDGTVYLKEIRLGDEASLVSYTGQLPDFSCYNKNSSTQRIIIPEIKNVESLSVMGGDGLISNLAVSDIQYEDVTENGFSRRYGYAEITFDIVLESEGEDTLHLIATGAGDAEESKQRFVLKVTGNMDPEIDAVADMLAEAGENYTLNLSGINDGDKDVEQVITVSATSSDESVVSDFQLDYIPSQTTGTISIQAIASGNADVILTVEDNEGAFITDTFKVTVYDDLNHSPEIDPVSDFAIWNTSGQSSLKLTGISDGDEYTQDLSFTVIASGTDYIENLMIDYTPGEDTAKLNYNVIPGMTGNTDVTITLTDDGDDGNNNGDLSTSVSFTISTITPPVTGYELDLGDPGILDYFSPEEDGVVYFLSVIDTLGEKVLKVVFKEKWTFAGIWISLPEELNLTDYPLVSYEVLSKDQSTFHWNYLYDVNVNRNIANSGEHQYEVPANEWTNLLFDYRQENDMDDSEGNPIDASRINALLLNLHDARPSYPFTNATGVVYLRNIMLGDKVEVEPIPAVTTIDDVGEKNAYENEGEQVITLAGISNGSGSINDVTIMASSSNTDIIATPTLGDLQEDGSMSLTFNAASAGSSMITIDVEATGAEATTITFPVNIIAIDPSEIGTINISMSEEYQTIRGLGSNRMNVGEKLFTEDLMASCRRISIVNSNWEPENENNDPNILDMEGFNYNAFNWDLYRRLGENGVESFFITSFSPPSWMKRNLSQSHKEQATRQEFTDNVLEKYYYEEFAESIAALVKAFQERSNIKINGVGLQNEPYFNEPYPSMVLSPEEFVKLIVVVGNRLEKEGLGDVVPFGSEQVFGFTGSYGREDYLNKVIANAEADEISTVYALHGYDQTGVTTGFPNYSDWVNLYELAQSSDYPKELWMTETTFHGRDWTEALNVAGAIHGSLWAGNVTLWCDLGDFRMNVGGPNPLYYASKHYFKYVRPGAVRVGTESLHEDLLATAFKDSDGKFVMVIINKGNQPVTTRIQGEGLPVECEFILSTAQDNCVQKDPVNISEAPVIIPSRGIVTLVEKESTNLGIIAPEDVIVLKNSGESSSIITGIDNGSGSTDNLEIDFSNSNPELFSDIRLGAINTDGTANLSFTPAPDVIGTAMVSLVLTDDLDNSRPAYFFITVEDNVRVMEDKNAKLKLYPNPSPEKIVLDYPGDQEAEMKIVNLQGKLVKNMKIQPGTNELELGELPKGIYMIRVEDGKFIYSKALVLY